MLLLKHWSIGKELKMVKYYYRLMFLLFYWSKVPFAILAIVSIVHNIFISFLKIFNSYSSSDNKFN